MRSTLRPAIWPASFVAWRSASLKYAGTVTTGRLATSPTSTSPVFENATTEGVVRDPSALAMTVGSPPSSTETTELVVPRSMPTALGMGEPPIVGMRDRKLEHDDINSAGQAAIPATI